MRGRMPGWVARPDRSGVMVKAALRTTGQELPVTIIDMSEQGCKIRCLHTLPIGELVELVPPLSNPTQRRYAGHFRAWPACVLSNPIAHNPPQLAGIGDPINLHLLSTVLQAFAARPVALMPGRQFRRS